MPTSVNFSVIHPCDENICARLAAGDAKLAPRSPRRLRRTDFTNDEERGSRSAVQTAHLINFAKKNVHMRNRSLYRYHHLQNKYQKKNADGSRVFFNIYITLYAIFKLLFCTSMCRVVSVSSEKKQTVYVSMILVIRQYCAVPNTQCQKIVGSTNILPHTVGYGD